MGTPRPTVGLALALALLAGPLYAQSGSHTATLSGIVVDPTGGFVTDALVRLKNAATGESFSAATNESGAYSFPGLAVGSYTLTIARPGFKTAEYTDIRLNAGSANSLATTLTVGTVSEVVTVPASTDLYRTQTPTVISTVHSDFIQTLPRNDRNALNFLIFLPGVETIGGAINARESTVSGLPQNTINITIDGITNSNLLRSDDGFFSMVTPRLDAVEEVALTTAAAGADASAKGAVQIRFVTRSGTDQLDASVYTYLQHKNLNSNTFFNRLRGLPRLQATNVTYGGRIGGPILIPGVFDGRGRAFFFFNHEGVYRPFDVSLDRTVLRDSALAGNFTYNRDGPTTVNLWALAAAGGQISTYDPVVLDLLNSIRAATTGTGTLTEVADDPNRATFSYLSRIRSLEHAPTTSVTVSLSPAHRLQGAYHWQRFSDTPSLGAEAMFPGFELLGTRSSYRTSASIALRSIVSESAVNELRGGWHWSPLGFENNTTPEMFANQGGFDLQLGLGLTGVTPNGANFGTERNTANWTIDNTFNWLRGAHQLTAGANFTRVWHWNQGGQHVPFLSFGVDPADPAEIMFGTGPGQMGLVNFPGSSFFDRSEARDLYALLTGRVTDISADAVLNESRTAYTYNGLFRQSARMDEYGFFVQDSWRWTPDLTLTAGLRYQLQLPMQPTGGVFTAASTGSVCGVSGPGDAPLGRFCNIFNPGVFNNPGAAPGYVLFEPGVKGYETDVNNFAPNVGISWQPNVTSGWLRALLGDPEHATISAGFTRSINLERVDRFLSVYGNNPGQVRPASRGQFAAFPLVEPGESWPVLLREPHRLGPPDFPRTLDFPLSPGMFDLMTAFDPEIETPYTDSWTASLQRSLSRNTAVELRYVGNVNHKPWTLEDWNTPNIRTNGFLEEFRLAQANLLANVQAGRGGTFAYLGPGTGTSPLPLLLAHFSGLTASAASDPVAYEGAGAEHWTSAAWVPLLHPHVPRPSDFANRLRLGFFGELFDNARTAGLPANFWVMNPDVFQANVMRNLGGSHTNQLIVEVRRRLARGFAANASYTWSRTSVKSNLDLHQPPFDLRSEGVPHAFKMLWLYEVPVGREKRFGAGMSPWLDGVVGGWTISGTGRAQIESFVLRNTVLVGMTRSEAQKELENVRFVRDPLSGTLTLWNMAQDIIDNTRRAFSVDATSPTLYPQGQEPKGRYFAPASTFECPVLLPGDCGVEELWFRGRWVGELDLRIAKRFDLPGRARLEFAAEVLNALMAKNFPSRINPARRSSGFRIEDTQSGPRTAQLSWRVSW